ncbi:hypothetical protein SNOG_12327 [Parastagonospora nodorum SN15]|uniref:Uncharacterized protein n=1 Tax=Phaeosphaeria nodorum (strain SN15 / ATCC MYA-4574 / FGSC 10173) TaxID=321614 RepID=Q0U7D7_PHANO|nr:hypothetical protein SNOG_12327 [Parastagonospora nodorum SN15]EAT80140.1 hypothetical protein SNOG_12327 [Parastagonospora nodorum SN15]
MSPTLSQNIFALLRYATVIMEAQISKQQEVKDD